MSVRQLFMASLAGSLLFWGIAWAQQDQNLAPALSQDQSQTAAPGAAGSGQSATTSPGAATTEDSPASTSTGNAKEKHWSGSLVDIPCMVKILKNDNQGAAPAAGSGPAVPQFMGSGFAGQAGQQPGSGVNPGATTPGQGGATAPTPTYPGPGANQGADNSGMTPQQSAQMAKATRIDNAAKQCAASPSTQTFGLAMSGGQVLQFDSSGNGKAQEALKDVQVQSGKKIKAKVTGTMQDQQTVRVASVEVKGKKAAGTASNSGAGR